MQEAAAIASGALSAFRTVAGFSLEERVVGRYEAALRRPLDLAARAALAGGLSQGLSQLMVFAAYVLVFVYGGRLVMAGEVDFARMVRTFAVLLNAALGVSSALSMMPDATKAREAAARILALDDLRSAIDPADDAGQILPAVRGALSLRGVHFAYPSRRSALVLRGLTLEVDAGRTVALVGPSGAGKSTVVALLERFYDPLVGEVLLDGTPLRALNVRWLRRQLGLVMQEPVLFDGTVGENIAYGVAEGASHHRVEAAARVAHAHDFIASLPHGYATQVGHAGSALSGGQKQRVAIARALLREPRVLIFDEATSALDGESERAVQRALDGLMAERRCTLLLIAHRLSTVRHADTIAVLVRGRLAESGTHGELAARPDGHYRAMVGADGDVTATPPRGRAEQ